VTQTQSERAGSTPAASARADRRSNRLMVLRVLLGMALMFALMLAIANTFRSQLESMGRAFVTHLGLPGMTVGSLIADGFHFPVAPQFYMLLGIASGTPHLETFSAVAIGSLLGGGAGYLVGRQLRRFARLARWVERSSAKFRHHLEGRNAYRGAVIATITPLPFSVLCYTAGLYHFSSRAFALILILRIPKLVVFYYLVWLGWSAL
jgi:membrane protein YqaA with SNARE-associated domain